MAAAPPTRFDDDGRAVRALTKKKATTKREEKEKKSGRRSRTRGVLAFESRHYVSLQSYLLSYNGLVVVVQKWMNEISLSFLRNKQQFQFQRLSRKKKRERLFSNVRSKDETFFFFFVSTLYCVCLFLFG